MDDYDDEDFHSASNADDGDANANDGGGFDDSTGYRDYLYILC